MKEATEVLRTDTFKDFEQNFASHVQSLTGLADMELGFRSFDPMDHYRLLELYIQETVGGLEFLPAELGSGTQSALAVALVRAYSQIVKEATGLVIEEPELYLHPHACRYFKSVLQSLSNEGVQVFYSTHSPSFVNLDSYNDLYIVRRKPGGGTEVSSGRNIVMDEEDRRKLKLESRFDAAKNEMFFAQRVLLVEGPSEKGTFKIVPDLMNIEFDQSGTSVVDTGSKTQMPMFSYMLSEFGIPHVCLVDKDEGKTTGQALTDKIANLCGAGNIFIMDPDLEGELGVAPNKLNYQSAMSLFAEYTKADDIPVVIRNAVDKLCPL
jgi:predicted ATP-dependent endonuclease of OLD family